MGLLQQVLGIALPVIQAPMAGVQGSALALAVSNAGGLGSLPCAMLAPDALRAELATLRAQTTRPYNVNFFCHSSPPPDAAREAAWRQLLAPYYAELGIDPAGIATGPGRLPFDAATADLLAEFKPPVVSFHFGLPDVALLDRVRSWGAKIISSATTVEEARWLEARGVDVIVAQGLEAGGHRGIFLSDDLSTQIHRAALASEAARHTALTNLYTGRPARGIMTRLMREQGPLSTVAPAFPLATVAVTPLRAEAEAAGCGDFSPLWAGQNASGCRPVPAAQLTRELAGG